MWHAEFGKYTDNILRGEDAAIDWIYDVDLPKFTSCNRLYPNYREQRQAEFY